MPDVTDQESMVQRHVNNQFGSESYTSYITPEGHEYRTYGSAPYERWVDLDQDGWVDKGRRVDSNGKWTTFDGWLWKDDRGNVQMDYDPPQNRSSGEHDAPTYENDADVVLFASSEGDAGWIF